MHIGSKETVDVILHRLAKQGTIRRLARGVYAFPKEHPVLGPLAPSAEAVALGLTEQVPAKAVFLTDGPTRTVKVGPTTIQLRRTTPKNMEAAGRLSGLLIQALRKLGQEHVTQQRQDHLKRTIPASKGRELLKDLRLAPAWMHPIFRELAEEEA